MNGVRLWVLAAGSTCVRLGAAQPVTEPPPAEAEPPAHEVLVLGDRRELGRTRLSAEEVREMPGAFGDAFRAVEALPGVAPPMSGVPYFFVRGGPPNNNGYFLEGIRLPSLFHVALGPSVVHPALVDAVDFYPGAAPVSLGGVAGAVVAGKTRSPANVAHGEANLRLVDAGALLETPFADGNASALVAGRYGYPGPVLSAFTDVRLDYWDYQSRFRVKTGTNDYLQLFAFGSHDFLGREEPNGKKVEDFVSDFHRIDLRYENAWQTGRTRVAGTLGYDWQGTEPTYLENRSAELRFDLEQEIVPAFRIRGGLSGRIDAYDLEQGAAPDGEAVVPSNANPPPTNLTGSAHLDFVWRPVRRVELVPGARVTVFDSSRDRSPADSTRVRTTVPAIDPRLSARVTLASSVALLSTFGIAHQYPALRIGELPALFAAGAGFPPGNARLQRTAQLSQGLEVLLPAEVMLTATGFMSRSTGLTDLTASCLQIEPPSGPSGEAPRADDPYFCPSNAPVKGHAYGFELLVRRSLGEHVTGWLSYTLSRSVRETHFLTLDGGDVVATVPSDFDRTHVLNAILAYDLGRNWRAGNRFVFYSGTPYSELAGNVPAPPYNSHRAPPFFRVDVRLEKRWRFGPERSLAFVFEVQNVTLSQETNTLGMDCRGEATPDMYTNDCDRRKIGPITIPSVGVEAVF